MNAITGIAIAAMTRPYRSGGNADASIIRGMAGGDGVDVAGDRLAHLRILGNGP